jgi:hypothetical protein
MGSNPYILGGEITAEGRRLLEQGRGLEREAKRLLERIAVQPGWRVLDVGCGPLGILETSWPKASGLAARWSALNVTRALLTWAGLFLPSEA